RRTHGTAQEGKAPALVEDLRAMVAAMSRASRARGSRARVRGRPVSSTATATGTAEQGVSARARGDFEPAGTAGTGVSARAREDWRLLELRERALLLLGFAGAFRRSELVSLDVEDLEFSRAGLVVRLRRSKTDQEG